MDFIHNVDPNGVTIADLVIGAPNHQDVMKWMTHWYAKQVDVPPEAIKELIIDGNNVFPIFVHDSLEKILERFAILYPVLAKASVDYVRDMRLDNDDGQSGAKYLRSLISIPPILKAAVCTFYGKNCFTDRAFIKKFSRLAPKLMTCDGAKL
jgi:hypothetical protein